MMGIARLDLRCSCIKGNLPRNRGDSPLHNARKAVSPHTRG